MFCVIEIKNEERTYFEKIFARFLKTKYYIRTVPVFKGAPFYVLTAVLGRNGFDWRYIAECIGKCSKRLVLPQGVDLPQDDIVCEHKSRLLYNLMCQNTFLYILKEHKKLFDICLIDRKSRYTDFAERLSKCAKTFTVVTENKKIYSKSGERIMNEIGLCPVIQTDIPNVRVKIDADNNLMTIDCENEILNIGNGYDFTVPEIYERLLPVGVPKYDFYSALFELCGVFSIGECIFDTIDVNNEKKAAKDIHFT